MKKQYPRWRDVQKRRLTPEQIEKLDREVAIELHKMELKKRKEKKPREKPGPKEERLTIPENWKKAVKKSFQKKKPPGGWPKP